jgi:hypothetical protein
MKENIMLNNKPTITLVSLRSKPKMLRNSQQICSPGDEGNCNPDSSSDCSPDCSPATSSCSPSTCNPDSCNPDGNENDG